MLQTPPLKLSLQSVRFFYTHLTLIFLLQFPLFLYAQSDTLEAGFNFKETIAPVSLTLAGFAVQGEISRKLQQGIVARYPDFHTTADNYLWAAPAALTFGLSAAGVEGRYKPGEQLLLFFLSNAVSAGATQIIKWVADYPRPDGSGHSSFPSGHTAIAFTNAMFLHKEYGHRSIWFPIGGFANATAVAGLRLMNNRHWLADVVSGAGIGIGATSGVYMIYPVVKRMVRN